MFSIRYTTPLTLLLADPTSDLSCTVCISTGFFTAEEVLPWLPPDLPEAVPLLHAHQTNHHTSQETVSHSSTYRFLVDSVVTRATSSAFLA